MFRSKATLASLVALVLVATGLVVVLATRSSTTEQRRPNFVFVLTDDLAINLIPHMPAVEAMEREGTTLSNYYVVDSLCCPSRSAILTGEYPHDDGVFGNMPPDGGYKAFLAHDNEKHTFGLALQQAGYTTGFMGKYINGYEPNEAEPVGWNEWDVTGNAGYNEFNYTLNENGKQQKYGHAASDYFVDVMATKGAQFVTRTALQKHPFLLELATYAPHFPYTPAPRYANSDKNVTYPRTPAWGTLPTNPPVWLKGRPPLTKMEITRINNEFRERVRAVHAVNDMINKVEGALKSAGVADNTYVVFSSDNGLHMGENRLAPGKESAFDTDIHVPLVVIGPHVPKGRTDTRMASSIDLAPTFERLAGIVPPSTVDGTSLVPLWEGQSTATWQQAVLVEHHGSPKIDPNDPDTQSWGKDSNPPSYEAVRTATALYVKYTTNNEVEYYDTAKDPYERDNLGAQAVPADMKTALTAMQACHGATQCQAAARMQN